ncbi:MAG: hypothetical protein JNK49_21120 [Planctomycetes bacterium]|nr:hypothetical protein [Planctomycetota bacterium]
MPRPLALFVPLLGLAGLGAWWLLQSGSDTPPPSLDGEPAAHGPEAADAAHADVAAAATAAVAEAGSDPAVARDAVQQGSLLPIPDDAVWIEVRTVDAATQEPIAGAEVHWYDDKVNQRAAETANQKGASLPMTDFWRDPELLAKTYGWHTHSDARGVARIHQTRSTRVVARSGPRYGTASVGRDLLPPRGGHRVELEVDRELRIQVLDSTGRPALGIPVTLAGHAADGKLRFVRGWGAQAETKAPDGIATVRHVQQPVDSGSPLGIASWRVRTFVPGLADVSAPCSIDEPPAEPLVLRLPPSGALRVRVEVPPDAEGTPRQVTVRQARRDRRGEEEMGWVDEQRALTQTLGPDGVAHFPWVPLGTSFQVRSWQQGMNLSQTVTGPQTAGAIVEVVLRPPAEQIQVVGRLVDDRKEPLASTRFMLQLSGPNLGTHEQLRTDANGNFRLGMRRPSGDARAETIRFQMEREGQPALAAALTPRTIQAAIEDFGEVTMAVEPLVVGGRWSAPGKPRDWRPELRVEAFRDRQGKGPEWRRTGESMVRHFDDAGTFAIHGKLPPGRYRLVFGGNEHLPHDPVEFVLGQSDLLLEFAAGGLLRASVLLPKQTNEEPIGTLVPNFQANLSETMKQRLRTSGSLIEGRWQLTWPSLPPGNYRLEIGLTSLPQPLATVENVAVPLPPEGDDRLVDIDLAALLRIVAVQLFAADGQILNSDNATGLFVMPQAGDQELRGSAYWGKDTQIVLPRDPVELLVAVHGHRPRTVTCGGDRLELRLEPWPRITLVFENLPQLPPEFSLHTNLRSESTNRRRYRARWQDGEMSELAEVPTQSVEVRAGRAEVPIGDGPHKVEVYLRSKSGRSRIAFDAPSLLMLAGEAVVTLPAEALAKAIEARQKADQQRAQNENRR